jgi:threonine/homoserine/homoserine lactone efflux protein
MRGRRGMPTMGCMPGAVPGGGFPMVPDLVLGFSAVPFAAIAAFAAVTAGTPGPNNLMLTYSGLAFGLRRTLPALAGIYLGCALLFVVCAVGVSALVNDVPMARRALSLLGGAYLAWMAWRMRSTAWTGSARARPLGWSAAALMQLVNPKLWWMCAFTLARFSPPAAAPVTAGLVAAVFMLCTLPCLLAYTLAGAAVTRFARSPQARRRVNAALSLLTLATAVAVVAGA